MADDGRNSDELDKIMQQIQNLQVESSSSADDRRRRHERSAIFHDTFGGFIQGYEFDCERGDAVAHGLVTVECDPDTGEISHREATFLVLRRGESGRRDAVRMFEATCRLRGSVAIANAFLVANCDGLKRWVICYEKLAGILSDYPDDHMLTTFGAFSSNGTDSLSPYWSNQIKMIITTLSDMGIRNVSHGGMSNPEIYALTESLDIKLINMGKNENSRTYQHDLADFGTFLCQTPYIGASKCTSWTGFHFLINSNAMSQRYLWADIVKGHPLFLDPPSKLRCYVNLFEWSELIQISEKTAFCDACYKLMPDLTQKTLWGWISCCPASAKIYLNQAYKGISIYEDIITFVKNMILHGIQELMNANGGRWSDAHFCHKIEQLFPGFMSVAYALSKATRSDLNKLLGRA
uniref:Uncharacterized protein n=1 Tax=Oryza meridionalis TaxID=40149 RepID=A0A0E0FCF6_9ORYZ